MNSLERMAPASISAATAQARDGLAARLADRAERPERRGEVEPGLLAELAPGGVERFLAGFGLALGDGPGAVVLLRPERAAGMNEEYLDRAVATAVRQEPGAQLRQPHLRPDKAKPPRADPGGSIGRTVAPSVAFALQALAQELAVAAHRLGFLAGAAFGRFLVVAAELHLAKYAFALHLLLEGAQRLIDVVVANENLHEEPLLSRPRRKRNWPRTCAAILALDTMPPGGWEEGRRPLYPPPRRPHIDPMAILKIARMGHPVLRRKAEMVADPTAPAVRRLVADMVETLADIGGAGLAAPQVHVPLRVVIFRVPEDRVSGRPEDDPQTLLALVNPVIEPLGEARELGWEGCLSVPGLRGAVSRFSRIRYQRRHARGRPNPPYRRRLSRSRGAARMRSSRRHPLSPAHDRSESPRVHRGGRALSDRSRRRGAGEALAMDEIARKDALLAAILPDVPFDGWTRAAMAAAAQRIGMDRAELAALFPGGPRALAAWFSHWADRLTLETMASRPLDGMKGSERIALGVRTRLALLLPHREAVRRGLALMALPQNAPLAARLLYDTVDALWYAAGDHATDFSFYTKRGILAGIYAATTLYWLDDRSPGGEATEAFLARRLAAVSSLPRVGARFARVFDNFPNPLRLLRHARTRI